MDAGYLQKRELCTGIAGWVLLAGLGVAAVISGDAGWSSGPAELGSALPTAGGGYTVARRALGPWAGCAPASRCSSSTPSPRPRSPRSSASQLMGIGEAARADEELR